jgi:hypothetical protein
MLHNRGVSKKRGLHWSMENILVALVCTICCSAQQNYRVSGSIVDPTGAAVSKAEISLLAGSRLP